MHSNAMYDYGSYGHSVSMYTNLTAYIGIILIILLIIGTILIISMWKIFLANGENGWKSLIPFYNIYILLKIVKLPEWYLILYLIPIINIYILYKTNKKLSELYGKSTIFAVLCIFMPFVCYPILAFGSSLTNKNSIYNDQQMQTNNNIIEPIEKNVIVGENETLISTEVNRTIQSSDSSILMSQSTSLSTEPTVVQSSQPTFEQQQIRESNISVNMPTQQNSSITIPNGKIEDRFCPNCGSKIGIESKVCFMCGTRI